MRNHSCASDSGGDARPLRDDYADFLPVLQGYVVKHECVRSVPHTARVENAAGKGITRCTSPWCVYCLVADHRVSDP